MRERGRPTARLGRAVLEVQVHLRQPAADEGERGGDLLVIARDVDVIADGADEQLRPLTVRLLQDRVVAQAEKEGAERVTLLLPGSRLELAQLAVRSKASLP